MSLLRGVKGWVMASAVLGVLAMGGGLILGCGDDGDSNTPGGGDVYRKNSDGTGGDSRLVGDWLVLRSVYDDGYVREENGEYEKVFFRITSSGKAMLAGYDKVENFWMGGFYEDETASWYANGQTQSGYLIFYEWDRAIDTLHGSYRFSGNEVTATYCYSYEDWDNGTQLYIERQECRDIVCVKSDANSVSPIRSGDPALDLPYDDSGYWEWVLQGDENQTIEFYGSGFYDDRRYYYVGANHNYGYYYTTGTRLFLLYGEWYWDSENEIDGPFIVDSRVELDYKVTGTGNNKTLTIRRVLPGGSLSDPDIWKAVKHSYDYAPAKSRQNARPSSPFGNGKDSGKGTGLFPRPPAARSR